MDRETINIIVDICSQHCYEKDDFYKIYNPQTGDIDYELYDDAWAFDNSYIIHLLDGWDLIK